jgi:hypothetical protein
MFIKIIFAIIVVLILTSMFKQSFEKMLTMKINAEKFEADVNATNFIPPQVDVSASSDPRFNFMQAERYPSYPTTPVDYPTANIYALGQTKKPWQAWREKLQSWASTPAKLITMGGESMIQKGWSKQPERSAPSQYGPTNVGTASRSFIIRDSSVINQVPSEKFVNNDNVFKGPPGYDITMTRTLGMENLSNNSSWSTEKSQEKMGSGDKDVLNEITNEGKYAGILHSG